MRPPNTLASFFAARVVPGDGGCWICLGNDSRRGYQVVCINGRRPYAHRYVYEEMVGPIPAGLQLDHLCRTPACVNPEHLEPVTPDENMRRTRKPTCSKGHPLTDDNVLTDGNGKRRNCRTCNRLRAQARRDAAKAVAA